MAKKTRKRSPKTRDEIPRPSPSSKDSDNPDVIEGPGFRMERHGRFLHTTVSRTHEEQRALLEKIAGSEGEQRALLAHQTQALEDKLRKYDTFTVLSALSLQNHLADPESYKEVSHPGKSYVPEYASLLALKTEYSTGEELYANGQVLNEFQSEIENLFGLTVGLQMARDARRMLSASQDGGPGSQSSDTLQGLQMVMRLHELGVRSPAYAHHHHEVLRELFAPFNDNLIQTVGFSIDEAIKLSGTVTHRISRIYQERLGKASRDFRNLEREVARVRNPAGRKTFLEEASNSEDPEIPERAKFILELGKKPPKDVRRYLSYATMEWLLLAAGDICAFSAEDLSSEGNVRLESSTAFTGGLSIEFGSVPQEFAELSQTHPLRTRPLLRRDKLFLCPAPMLLDWALQPLLEAHLKSGSGKTWDRYQKHRHDVVLRKSIELLSRMMPRASFSTNLRYGEHSESGRECELDGLGRFDSMVFLIEAKAQDITEPALRGAPERLRRTLRDIVAESHRQAVRTKSYLNSAQGSEDSIARFKRADSGLDADVSMKGVRDIVLLSVTLAPLGHLTAQLHANSTLGLFRPGEFSWVVNLYDLMVIADTLDLPAAFPHYVTRRVHSARLGLLEASDELDIFGYYLAEGLYLDDIAEEMRRESVNSSFRLTSYTGPFDDYYAYVTGLRRTPARKPVQSIPKNLLILLRRIHSSQLVDSLTLSLAILDLGGESRTALARYIDRARKISRRNRRSSNASIAGRGDGGWGITYWCDIEARDIGQRLKSYCERKRKEERAKKWYGVAEVLRPGESHVAAITVLA